MPDPVITSLHTDDQNNLWVGTSQAGLLLLNDGTFHSFNTNDGITASYVDQIKVDRFGYVWFGSKQGLYRVSREQLLQHADGQRDKVSAKYFSVINGLPSLDLSSQHFPAGTTTYRGNLLYNFGEAIVSVDPSKKFPVNKPSPPVVEAVSFDYQPVPNGQAHTVPPSFNSVEINYTVPNFGTPEQLDFKYKLEPFDKNWVNANSRRKAFYTNLPAGDYDLKIAARNVAKVQSPVSSFSFSVLPPWCQSTCAYIGYALLLILGIPGLVFGYNYWNTKRLEAQNKELRSIVDDRTKKIRQQKDKIEEQLEELEKQRHQRSRFFANISHEFRTPLTLIITPLQDMLDGKFGQHTPKAHQQFTSMLRNARRVNQLTSQLLDLSRLEVGKMPRNPVPIALNQFVESFTNEFVPLAKRESIDLSFTGEPDLLICHIDQDILIKILGNLLSNVFKFTPSQESISVSVGRKSDHALITITDTGIGIDPEKIHQIFDRFYQVDPDKNGNNKGAGIGLALVKELINSSGGRMDVSSADNETTFTIVLPLSSEHSSNLVTKPNFQQIGPATQDTTQPSKTSESQHANGEQTLTEQDSPLLLIVDDHPDIRERITLQFTDNYRTIEAKDGDEALERTVDELPDLIICDIMMPGTDGITFLENLRGHADIGHLPVIMLTAKSKEVDRLDSLQIGADAYITKPFSRKELSIRVEKLIEKEQKLRQHFRKKVLTEAEETDVLSDDEQFIVRLKDIVETNLANPNFTNKKFAKEAGCSQSKLNRKLKKILNTTPNQFVRTYRLKKSKQLLQKNSATVSEIAYSVGFNSLSYFSKCFKKEFGHAPSQV